MISIYNRYVQTDTPVYSAPVSKNQPSSENKQRPPSCEDGSRKQSIFSGLSTESWKNLFPKNPETGDLLLLLIFYLLYKESNDEEFLLILLILGFSIFRP